MNKIYTPLHIGQSLSLRVMEGAILNACELVPLSSAGARNQSILNNWKQAEALCAEDIFIGMDSDIVLAPGDVDRLLRTLDTADFAFCEADTRRETHGLWAIKKDALIKVPIPVSTSTCIICQWIQRLKEAGLKVQKCPFSVSEEKRKE